MQIDLLYFWDSVIMTGFADVWPKTRTILHGHSMGDVWACDDLPYKASEPASNLIPFHKLSQWMTYSLVEVMEKLAGVTFTGLERMTGLPEYRNGGLFVDMGALKLKPEVYDKGKKYAKDYYAQIAASKQFKVPEKLTPMFTADDPVIVEWRAMTVILLDIVAKKIREKYNLSDAELPLVKVLEGGTWKAGREIAKQLRTNGGPPIKIHSDGTVF